ncbi:MAG: hypothetical protein F7B17_06535 [Desulfurococcales archaeon]|nr:hypothetical protein [Desulfurococcales archaeon]
MPVEFLPVLSGLLAVYSAMIVYRAFMPKPRVEWALEVARTYRVLEEEAKHDKRAARKAKKLHPDYKRARSVLFRSLLLKLGLLMIFYTIYGIVSITTVPALPSPIRIPLLTVEEGGVNLIPSLHIHLASFALAVLLLKDELT